MAIAMDIQNGEVHKAGETITGLTYVTGTLVRFGDALADAVVGAEPDKRWAWAPTEFPRPTGKDGSLMKCLIFRRRVVGPAVLLLFLGLVSAFTSPGNAAGPGRYCGLLLYPNAIPQGPARRNRTNFALTTDSENDVVAWYAQRHPGLRLMHESGGKVLFLNPSGKNWSFTIDTPRPGQVRIIFNCDWARPGG